MQWLRSIAQIVMLTTCATNAAVGTSPIESVRTKPSFRMTPLVHTVEARPGEEIPFTFTVNAVDRDLLLQAEAVGLVQKSTGLIVPDEAARPPGTVRIERPGQLRVEAGEAAVIRGYWQIPPSPASFHAAGLLVTDLTASELPDTQATAAGQAACVKFVTRYLLRLEARVSSSAQAIVPTVDDGRFVAHQGRAMATVSLIAPPTGSGQWSVDARVYDHNGQPLGAPFALFLPVRARQPTDQRRQVPLLAGAHVLTMAPVPEPLFPGRYELEVVLSDGGHVRRRERFALSVGQDDFPAQRAVVAQVVRAIEVAPTQLELSTARGGNRLLPLRLTNRGLEPVGIELESTPIAHAHAQNHVDWLKVRPRKFTLPPGIERNVLVAVQNHQRSEHPRYAHIHVRVVPSESSAGGSKQLTVALVSTSPPDSSQFEIADPVWQPTAAGGQLELTVENRGAYHLAPTAHVTLTDDLRRQISSEGGFGRWILPGEQETLKLRTPHLPAGTYDLKLELTPRAGAQPQAQRHVLRVAGRAAAASAQR